MGRGRRVQPKRLAAKLLEIRERLDLSQAPDQVCQALLMSRQRSALDSTHRLRGH